MTDLKNHDIPVHWKRIESINIPNNLQTHSNLTYMYVYRYILPVIITICFVKK